ncbi:MAG: DUF4249 domain-containing protein [Bacteroidota bacterium]
MNHFDPTNSIIRLIKAFSLIGMIAFSLGCEKTVTVDIPESEERFVIEGYIQNDTFPVLRISRTLPYFGTVSFETLTNTSVTDARVIISDGFTQDTMLFIPVFGGIYVDPLMRGVPGRNYSIRVEAEGKILTASTLLPMPVYLDSTWWKVDGRRDSLGFAWAHITDPDTLGNSYRWFAQRINSYTYGELASQQKDTTFIAPLGSVFEDKFINGRSFDFNFPRGKLTNSNKPDDLNEEDFFFKRGDTIVVKFCSIDRSNFDFWRSEETQVSNNGNPFGSVTPVKSNIEGGLGIWGGYTATYDTIIAR